MQPFSGDTPLAGGYSFSKKLLLCIILLAFWIVLTATLALNELVLGAVCSAFVAAISVSLLGRALDPRITPLVLLKLPVFILRLIWEIVKANYDVAKIILNPRLPIDPRIVEYRTYLPDDLPRTVFSDSITLTPGTVTVELEADMLKVHCLCPYHEEGLAGLEEMVAWLFGVKKDG
jgi:multicomponent Na+:H+ antiporter subunit E